MGKVYVLVKVYPSSIDTNLDELVEDIKKVLPKDIIVGSYVKEPIAFGLYALKIAMIMPENMEGGTTIIEENVEKLPTVNQVEVEYVTRI
ncbi:MAG: elongation factor 1-beta [Candidatus Methanomethylicia archaeon]